MKVAEAKERRDIVRAQCPHGFQAFSSALNLSPSGIENRLIVGPREVGRSKSSYLVQARLGGVEQLVVQVEQAQPAEGGVIAASIGRLDQLARGTQLALNRRLEALDHRQRDGREIRCVGGSSRARGCRGLDREGSLAVRIQWRLSQEAQERQADRGGPGQRASIQSQTWGPRNLHGAVPWRSVT